MSFAINPLHIIFVLSALCFAIFWGWATWHAATTPNSTSSQKIFWAGSMLLNPLTAVWYWYIWKRWAFWLLFTPLLTTFATSPFIGKRLIAKSNAESIEALFAFLTKPGAWLYLVGVSIFVVFPLILRLIALVHLGKNKQVSALDRNDWIVALALPLFGFGAGIAYCAQHRRNWAIASLVWWLIFASLGYETGRFMRPAFAQTSSSSSSELRSPLR